MTSRSASSLAVFLLIILVAGCNQPTLVDEDKKNAAEKEKWNLEIEGKEVTEAQRKLINDAFSKLSKVTDFQHSVKKVNISAEKEHFEYSYGSQIRYAAAHNCTTYGRRICIRPEYLERPIIWHEAAHVFTHCRNDEKELADDWFIVAGDVYTDDYEDFYGKDPDNGLLTNYSRRNYLEDIAEWVECCYAYIYLNSYSWVFSNKYLKSDNRYRKKLTLLYKYGFFSDGDYRKLKPLFE